MKHLRVLAPLIALLLQTASASAGECSTSMAYKPYAPDCLVGIQDSLLIIPTPVESFSHMGAQLKRIDEICRPFMIRTWDSAEGELEDRNPLSRCGVVVTVSPDPNCRTCPGNPWEFGDVPVITVDMTSATLPMEAGGQLTGSEIIAAAFYSTLLTFCNDFECELTSVTLKLELPGEGMYGWPKLGETYHWDGANRRLKEGPLNGWELKQKRDGTWVCIKRE